MSWKTHLARIPSLFPELSHSRLLRRLALVDQAGGELDAEGLDGRAVLHDDHGADGFAGVLENRHDGDGVDAGGLAGFASGGFPDAILAVLAKWSEGKYMDVKIRVDVWCLVCTWSDH